MIRKKAAARNEIHLFDDGSRVLRVECPQNMLVRLLHFLSSKGFNCGAARIISADSEKRTRSIISFGIDGSTSDEVKFSLRVFLSKARIKFVENSDGIETVFHLAKDH